MATQAPEQRLDIGRVMSLGFRTLARNFLPFTGFALLLVGLPNFVILYLSWEQAIADADALYTVSFWVTVLVYWISSYLLQGIIVTIAVRDLSGGRRDIGDSAIRALGRLVPMIGLSIVTGIGIVLGLALLIVPGIILMLMWMVAVPVVVEERRGVFESLGRSAELTRGSKGSIFLLMLLYWVVAWAVSAAVEALTGYQVGLGDPGSMVLPIIAATLAQTLSVLLLAAVTAALYVELRLTREGGGADQLAAIFE